MGTESRPKITYILPVYDSRTGSHFFHIYEMLFAAARELDIFLVVERAVEAPRDFPFPVYLQRFRSPPLRFVELLFVLIGARLRGRRFFYTHYSFFGAVASRFASAVLGGTAYYWNAGLPWLYARGRFEEAVFQYVLRHTIVVTGTKTLASEYARRYGLAQANTRVMPNWINLGRFSSGSSREQSRKKLAIPGDAEVVLFLHRLARRKGAHLLPDIIEGVLARTDRAIFIIVGDGPERGNLERAIDAKRIASRVRILGGVPHRDVPDFFSAADVFLMPSEEEGFPHVLLEAMAQGLPYIASAVGGVRDMTPPELEPYLVTDQTPERFADGIRALLQMPSSDIERLRASERAWVRQFDLPRVLRRFVELFS